MANTGLSRKKLALFQALARKQGLVEGNGARLERRTGPAPLSFAQEGLWLLHQLSPKDPAYNENFAIRIRGRVDERALEQSVNYVVRRHEVLRSTFKEVDGTPLQTPAPELFIPLVIEDFCATREPDRLAAAIEIASAEARAPLDLTNGPLVRTKLIRVGKDETLLLLTIHHIAIDGWSYGILLREVAVAYEAYLADATPSLPDLPVQYADFARSQREHQDEARNEVELEYWTKLLSDAFPTRLALRNCARAPRDSAERQTIEIDSVLLAKIEQVAQRFGTTPFMIWISALSVLLSQYSGESDIVIGTPVSVRGDQDLQDLIGVFINTLALRIRFDASFSFRQLIANVHATCTEAFAHKSIPS